MDQNLLDHIVTLLIIPILPTVAAFIISWFKAKTEQIKVTTKQQIVNHYLEILNQTVLDVVDSLNQTTVKALKEAAVDGKLTAEEVKAIQKEAFDGVYLIIGNSAHKVLRSTFDDLDVLVAKKIECAVKKLKGGD